MNKTEKSKPRKKWAAVAAVVAAAVCLTVTAGAVNEWDYGRVFSAFFPAAREENLAPVRGFMSEIPDGSFTSTFTNYDVSVDGMIFDGYALMVSATVRGKDDASFDSGIPYHTDFIADIAGMSLKNAVTTAEVNDDGSLTLKERIYFREQQETGKRLCFSFSRLFELDGGLNVVNVFDEGSIYFDIILTECYETRKFSLTDGENNMEIELSPLAMIVRSEAAAREILESRAPGETDSAKIPQAWNAALSDESIEDIGVDLAIYDESGNVLLEKTDIYNSSLSVQMVGGLIYADFIDPIDADSAARIVWNNYEYNG